MQNPTMMGPFESERDARELPAVQAVYEAFDADPGVGRMAPHTHGCSSRHAWRPAPSSAPMTAASCCGCPARSRRPALWSLA